MQKIQMETKNPMFGKYIYPEAKAIMEAQQDATWTAVEIPVDKDKHDFLTNMNYRQRRLTDTTLELFVEIEQRVGEVWEVIASWYPHSEIEGACAEIARMEKAVHAFFYQKMSDVLNIAPEETLEKQQAIRVLREKLSLLEKITSNLSDDKPLSLATVAAIEQVLLFSNFAMLKSFKANGHNMIKNTLLGVDYVVADEQLHGEFATYLHNTHVTEHNAIEPFNYIQHRDNVVAVIAEIVAHEDAVIDYVFEDEPSINDITPVQLKSFIRTRANTILTDLNMEPMYDITDTKIAEWFYRGINSIKVHDFFSAGTSQYTKTWSLEGFSRRAFTTKKEITNEQ